MTRKGMLAQEGVDPSDDFGQQCASAAVVEAEVCAGGEETADYHKTINGVKYTSWLKNRLKVAFEALHRRKRMVLILDGASYHKHRGPDWVDASSMSKEEVALWLVQAGVEKLELEDGTELLRKHFASRPKDGGVLAEDLKRALAKWLKVNGVNTTVTQQVMEEDPHRCHRLLYTPPYESWTQPIEMIWGQVKHQVARQAEAGRTWQEAKAQTEAALRKLTPETCEKTIEHVEREMDAWLQTAAAGSLKQLGSLDKVGRLTREEVAGWTDVDTAVGRYITADELKVTGVAADTSTTRRRGRSKKAAAEEGEGRRVAKQAKRV